jgi:hypothetical protein
MTVLLWYSIHAGSPRQAAEAKYKLNSGDYTGYPVGPISGRIIQPFLKSGIRPDTGFNGRISGRMSGKSIKCYHDNLLFFIKILHLFFGNKKCPLLKFWKENIHSSGLMKLPACHIFSDNLDVEPDIRQNIRYPAFRLAGYPAKSVSGASLLTYSSY